MKKLIKMLMMTILVASSASTCAGSSDRGHDFLPTVSDVSLQDYVGQWYAITALPQFFTRRCVAQEAVYKLNAANEIGVRNICTKRSGRRTDIKGFAKTTSVSGVLELKFTSGFAGLFGATGDYNIIALDEDYRYALIGGQDRKSLWLLSRTKEISDSVYDEYTAIAEELGFDISKLVDSKF
jgi:apolipoprotein D and lipocalin family protein